MNYLTCHIYKPDRLLYYMPVDDAVLDAFYQGQLPEKLLAYHDSFGTYDCPGLFEVHLPELEATVLGIEFRPNDTRIQYPEDLDSILLPGSFMISFEVVSEQFSNMEAINKIHENALAHLPSEDFWRNKYSILENPHVREIFTYNGKNRIFMEFNCTKNPEISAFKDQDSIPRETLFRMAYFEIITNYYNWNYLSPHLTEFAFDGIQDFAFVHFDVKNFRLLNEIYGHSTANALLIRITKEMQKQDWIYKSAKCDNDNFAMMVKDMPEEEMKAKLEVFFQNLSILEQDPDYRLFYRCGVIPMKYALLLGNRAADGAKIAQAMGNSLNQNDILFYTEQMYDEVLWGNKLKAHLTSAIRNDEFFILLQPKYDIHTETIKGAEALVRWNYRGEKLLSPIRFIPFFEKDGSIGKVDDIVLHKVCAFLKHAKETGLVLYPISVNLSRKQMENDLLISHLCGIVDHYGIDHSLIDFELTESVAYDNQEYMIQVLNQLKERGFRISMDDFGTGYSSFSLLTKMPLDTLKIDKSFVDDIGTPSESEKEITVLRHIISMAKELGIHCLAEGVEDKTQVECLRCLGCDSIQGYYYCRPVPVCEYEEMLRSESGSHPSVFPIAQDKNIQHN